MINILEDDWFFSVKSSLIFSLTSVHLPFITSPGYKTVHCKKTDPVDRLNSIERFSLQNFHKRSIDSALLLSSLEAGISFLKARVDVMVLERDLEVFLILLVQWRGEVHCVREAPEDHYQYIPTT